MVQFLVTVIKSRTTRQNARVQAHANNPWLSQDERVTNSDPMDNELSRYRRECKGPFVWRIRRLLEVTTFFTRFNFKFSQAEN